MPDVAERAVGGRPRMYASQQAFDDLMGRVAVLEVQPKGAIVSGGVPAPVSAGDDKRFVEDAIVALLPIIGAGDGDLAPMAATINALLIARDLILANMGTVRDAKMRQLRENGYLGWAGIQSA